MLLGRHAMKLKQVHVPDVSICGECDYFSLGALPLRGTMAAKHSASRNQNYLFMLATRLMCAVLGVVVANVFRRNFHMNVDKAELK